MFFVSKAGEGSTHGQSGGYEVPSTAVQVLLPVEPADGGKLELSAEYRRLDTPLCTHPHHVYESIM